jgi:hypothetical protein
MNEHRSFCINAAMKQILLIRLKPVCMFRRGGRAKSNFRNFAEK